jgi:hypothetical protein
MGVRRIVLVIVVLSLLGIVSLTSADAAVTAVDSDIHISEVFGDGGAPSGTIDHAFAHDFIELTNTGAQDETLTGWSLKDDTDSHNLPIPDGTVIPAGGYVAFNTDDATVTGNFGIGKGGDAARVYDGPTLVDQFWFSANPGDGNDFNRCSIGSGLSAIVVTTGITPNAAPTGCPAATTALATVKAEVKVNEVLADGTGSGTGKQLDAIELYDAGTTSVPLAGWWLSDDTATHKDVLPVGTVIRPAGFLTYRVGASPTSQFLSQDIFLDSSGANLPGNVDFGIGASGDNAALVAPDLSDADRVAFGNATGAVVTAPATGNTISRCPDGTGSWALSFAATLGATNVCANPTDTIVKINEVDQAHGIVELTNISSTASANVAGFKLTDAAAQSVTIGAGSAIPAGGYLEVPLGAVTPAAAADTVTLLDGTVTVDTASWSSAFTTSWGRCPDGTGAFAQTAAITDGAAGSTAGANSCSSGSTAGYDTIRISEAETNGDPLGDWIEVTNIGSTAVDIGGMYLADNGGSQGDPTIFPADTGHYWQIPSPMVLPAHGYHAFFESNTFPFGLGNPDQARIFSPTKALVDSTAWLLHEAGATYVRCPGVTQGVIFTDTADHAAFINSNVSTPNAPNDCTPPVRINEVQASDAAGGPDWVEVTNVGAAPVDLSGWVLADDKDSDGDVIPAGTVLNPGAFLFFEPNNENGQFTNTTPASHAFGLGATGDEIRLYQAGAWNGTAYVAADLVDAFVFEDTSTKAGGAVQPQTVLADGVTKAGGPWPVNAASPSSPETYARCADGISQVVADGIGAWEVTSTPTQGTTNQCNGLFTAMPWPDTHNGQAVSFADNVDLGQNVSGLYFVDGDPRTTADDYIWAIQNGSSGLPGENHGDPGALYKLVRDASGNWGPAPGWEFGVPVRYLNNTTGEPDSEGVTAVDGKVYVASERDNTNDTVSKIAVLEVNPNNIVPQNGDHDGDLNATHEWDLGPDIGPGTETGLDPNNPGDANLGIEAVAFVPDSYLTSVGFKDEHTGAAYNPSLYPSHIDGGVFFVGLEKTGKLYGYVFNSDNTFTRIATVNTGFQTIQDLLWDPIQHLLWATCDNGCQGRSSIIRVENGSFDVQTVYSRPTGATQNLNNEGFTVAPISECVNGSRSAWWSDDSDDGNHWLRTASVDCTADTTNPTVTASAVPAANANGWNKTSVTVSFNCTDAGSGVDAAFSSLGDQTLTASGSATGTCVDNAGNTGTATATVLIDKTAPSITVPAAAVTAEATGSGGATVNYAALVSISDALSGLAPGAGCAPASATMFPVGTTTVTCQATDLAGNSAMKSFTVTVLKSGPLSVGPGQSVVLPQGTTVNGPVRVDAGGSLTVQGGKITGPLTFSDAASVQICGTTINGPLTITGTTGPVVVGDGGTCAGNTINGPVRISDSHGGVVFLGNTVSGPVRIQP